MPRSATSRRKRASRRSSCRAARRRSCSRHRARPAGRRWRPRRRARRRSCASSLRSSASRSVARYYHGLLTAFGWLAGLMAVLIGIGVSVDVALRYFGTPGLPWMLEASEYGLYLMTFFGAPWALRERAHVSIDIAVEAMPPKLRAAAAILTDVVGLAICAVLAWYALVIA